MTSAGKVLIVEDEQLIAQYFKIVVEHLGYSVCGIAETADDAIRMARDEEPGVVLMDVRLKGSFDGVYAAQEIFRHRPVPVIFITASKEPETMQRVGEDHPIEILIKPVVQGQLSEVLARHCPIERRHP